MQFEHMIGKKFNRLSDSLAREGYEPTMYATKWWMTLFTFSLPFSHVVRVWDIFMLEGWKMGIRVGLAIMKTLEKHLVEYPFDMLIEHFKPEYLGGVICSANDFIKVCLLTDCEHWVILFFEELLSDSLFPLRSHVNHSQ